MHVLQVGYIIEKIYVVVFDSQHEIHLKDESLLRKAKNICDGRMFFKCLTQENKDLFLHYVLP